jgi:diguanylate cyclase (GGDEF)-like protein
MKVDEPKPVELTAPMNRDTKTVTASTQAFERKTGQSSSPVSPDLAELSEDIASFHGLDRADLTDRARKALMELVVEVAELRQEIGQNRKRIDYLTDLADRDGLTGVLNRRAFVREISHAQIMAREYQTENILLFLSVEDLETLNVEHSRAAGDAAIEHVAEVLRQHVGESDVIGRLGGTEFGVVLIASDVRQATEKADWIARVLENQIFFWEEAEIALRIAAAVHPLSAEEDAASALAATDRHHRI